MPTASFAPPLNREFGAAKELPHVWPDPEGEIRGVSFSPLHKSAPKPARIDHELDVDVIVELASRHDYHQFSALTRTRVETVLPPPPLQKEGRGGFHCSCVESQEQ